MIHLIRGRVISTACVCPPIPIRKFDWTAVDDATYDGAPDSGPVAHCQGFGETEDAAICDLFEQLEEHEVVKPLPPPITFANGLGGIFVRDLEKRSMSSWTDAELAAYNALTGQAENE